jgi:molybdopterin-guanine dinucleotide biosynthesis protein A
MTTAYAAILLAGGGGRRLGGRDKPGLPVGGRTMLSRVLDAVAGASPRIVVGPTRPDLPPDVAQVRESPPGGGPVAALAAGLAALAADADGGGDGGLVAVLAADLPFLTSGDVDALRRAAATGDHDGAVLVDADGRQQWLCGVWRIAALRHRLTEVGSPAGQPMRAVVAGLRPHEVDRGEILGPPPWYDCDTEGDYRRAEEWSGHEPAR